jgi:hypothetical protein
MYAVGICSGKVDGTSAKVFGLFMNDDGNDMHWEPIIDSSWNFKKDHLPSSIGSGDGKDVFFATNNKFTDAKVYRLTASANKVTFPSSLSTNGVVSRLVVQSDLVVYAAYNGYGSSAAHPGGQGYLLKTTDGGKKWTRVLGGLPDDAIYGIDDDWTTNPKVIYVSTDNKVYASTDEGNTWKDFSTGLPSRPHCGDLRFAIYSDGTRHLYLGTYGQSLWFMNLV